MLSPRYDLSVWRDAVVPMDETQAEARDALFAKLTDGRYSVVDHACPVCGSRDYTPLANRDRYGLPSDVAICRTCGLIQGTPYLSERSLNEFYAGDFPLLHRASSTPTEEKFCDRRRYAAGIARWLRQNGVQPGKRLLDVGCSSGGVLQGLVDAGFDGYGVEINKTYASYAQGKGLKVQAGTLQDVLPKVAPDVVSYCQVLEHIPDLDQELSILRSKASAEMLVYIEVPGIKKLWPIYHYDFLKYLQLAHIWHFSLETLTALMKKHGFKLVAGDQYVRALYALDTAPAGQASGSDYEGAMASLRRSELIRRIYPVKGIKSISRFLKQVRKA